MRSELSRAYPLSPDTSIAVLALTRYSRLGASSRMRTFQYISPLRAFGVDVTVSPLFGDKYLKRLYSGRVTNWFEVLQAYAIRAVRLLESKKFHLVWIEKELFPFIPPWFEESLSRAGIKYVVDYDDAIFHNYDQSRNPFLKAISDKIDKVMKNARLVVCGNQYLAARAWISGAPRIEIIPTVVDLDRYTVTEPSKKSEFVLGWIGSPSTVKYLYAIAPILKDLAASFPINLRIIGASFSLEGVNVDCRTWAEEQEVEEIRQLDIGIMPLVDTPWEHGKCGYKLIQYMACGLPVVCSPVGANREIVEHGGNGFLAKERSEWRAAISLLYSDFALRHEMGARGRKVVEQRYCLQMTAPRLAQLLRDVALQPT